ncbi:MAG: universal stress protein [Actinomycetota bacterium]|nr:universal stress protein [Actinomycetota bacterium]
MILICYDGSPDARTAIEHAGELLGGQGATVLTIWETLAEVLAHTPSRFGLSAVDIDFEKVDASSRTAAESTAAEGAELARKTGLTAEPEIREQTTTVAAAILDAAGAVDASAIVVGSRGLTGIKSLLLGSVSHALLHQTDLPVMVVPSAEVAAARAASRSA